jgi:hypothetical protein
MDQHGIRRTRRAHGSRPPGSGAGGCTRPPGRRAVSSRRAELGFQDLAAYLQRRYVEQGWSVRRIRTELRVGRRWLAAELARLGLRR